MKKTFSLIVAVAFLLSCFSMCVVAKEPEPDGFVEVEGEDIINFSPEVQIELPDTEADGFETNKFYGTGSTADDAYLFYNQLTNNQKTLYSEFLAAGVAESFVSSITSYTATGTTVNNAVTNVKAIISEDVKLALSAAAEDYPYYFWSKGFGYSFSYYKSTISTGYSVNVVDLKITINIDTNSYTDYADVETKLAQLVEAVEAVTVNGITRYEKVKSIHDYICKINEYPEKQGTFSDGSPWYGAMAHEPTGVFLKGFAVCEGYAEAFKLLCDREGIPCITVVGTGNGGGHKWNYVKMEDNKWYLMDATWNDQSANVYNDYLLIGTDTKTPHFHSSTVDSSIHVPTGMMYSTGIALQYPTLATEHYGKVMLNYNPGDITIEDSMNVIFVGKDVTTLQSKFTLPTGFSTELSSYTDLTGGIVQTTKTATGEVKTYKVAKRGDIDGSNTTNTTDYTKVVTASSAGSCPTKNTAEFYAGDINHDGAIDGFDAIALDLYLEDTLKFD